MPAKPECQRAVLIDLLHDSRIPNEYKKAVRWALCVVDTVIQERQDQETRFQEFLNHASQVVASWPNWKRKCLALHKSLE